MDLGYSAPGERLGSLLALVAAGAGEGHLTPKLLWLFVFVIPCMHFAVTFGASAYLLWGLDGLDTGSVEVLVFSIAFLGFSAPAAEALTLIVSPEMRDPRPPKTEGRLSLNSADPEDRCCQVPPSPDDQTGHCCWHLCDAGQKSSKSIM